MKKLHTKLTARISLDMIVDVPPDMPEEEIKLAKKEGWRKVCGDIRDMIQKELDEDDKVSVTKTSWRTKEFDTEPPEVIAL